MIRAFPFIKSLAFSTACLFLFSGFVVINPQTNHPYGKYFKDGVSVGNLNNAAEWQEISGITNPTLPANAGYLWAESDGSVDKLFAVSTTNASNQGEWDLSGTINGSDYEDLSSARINGQSYIYLADMGDNANARATIIIYRIKEPTITGSNGTVPGADIETITCQYPSAPEHKDAETLLVDPDTGSMYIITKRETLSAPNVYSLAHQASYVGTQTLVLEGEMFDIPDVSSTSATGNAVGGNISPDGKEILVKSYNILYRFARPNKSISIFTTLQGTPDSISYVGGGSVSPAKSHPNAEPQGEAVTFDYYGKDIYSASEYVAAAGSSATSYPLFKYERLANKAPTTYTFQEGVSASGTSDTYIQGGGVTAANSSTNRGNDANIILDITPAPANTDDRRALLKFDFSTIPTTCKVISATMNTYLTAEGQGWAWYRMLVDWNESSTFDSMTGGVTNDGVEAAATESARNGVNLDTILSVTARTNFPVTEIQDMVSNPSTNYGWLGVNTDTGGDGVQFASSETANPNESRRPQMIIQCQ